ncbi:MAG: CHAT domain-containing tetratricopeptide repeat protein [Ferruginibacter sp.]
MMGYSDKPNRFSALHLLLFSRYLIFRRYKRLFIINSLLLLSGSLFCQCPRINFFKEKVNSFIFDEKKIKSQSNELLQLQQQMKACHYEADSSFMFLLQMIGFLNFKQTDYQGAINFTNESIVAARKCISNHSCNIQALVHNYSNLFYYYNQTGQLEEKYAAIDSCILYFLQGSGGFNKVRVQMVISALDEKTTYLFNKGEYSLCYRDSKLGEDITEKYYHGEDSTSYIANFVSHQANCLYFSKKISSAEKLSEGKISQLEKTRDRNLLHPFYGLLGLINRDKKNYTEAISYFQKAYYATAQNKDSAGCAQNLAFIGSVYAKYFNRYDTGLKYCARALKYAHADSLVILKETGNIYVLKGMYDRAQYFFQQAFNTVQQGMNESTMLQNSFQFPGFNMLQSLSDLVTEKGDAYVQQYYHTKNDRYLKMALGIYKKGDLFLAKIKNEQQLQLGSNLVWRSTARNLYEHAIEACYANNNIEDAFYFFEKSRAILLNDQINEQRWMADTDIAKLAKNKKKTIDLERDLAALPASSNEYLTIQNKLGANSRELDGLVRTIKNKKPLFYQNYLDTVFMTVPQLRKNILNDSKTLVEIFSGDSAVYALTITPSQHFLTKINKQSYDSLTGSFNLDITNPGRLNKNFAGFIKTAQLLYSLLFRNINPPDGSIIISPDGVSYPFEALVTNEENGKPVYFLNHYATSYTYSVKYLTNQFAVNTNTSNNVLGIAPVQYNYLNLAELHGSDLSLKTINNYFSDVTNYVLEKATKNNFLQNFPKYNIIQLYTHAADSSSKNDPVIYFADSPLYLSELLPDQKPVTQLVVLSACETAKGKLYEGEGIFSFNRGFAALGIPAAVSNLWSVDNESTYLITELFYKYLSQGLPTDIALQKAKLEFINNSTSKENKLPYFWAGSILTGKVDIIKSNPGFPWKGFAAAAITLLFIGYFTKKYLDKQKKSKPVDYPKQA